MNAAYVTWDLLTCEVDAMGGRRWYDEAGELHRESGPAAVTPFGTQRWYKHGLRHRDDGPAVIYPDGEVEYWIEGDLLTEKQFNARRNLNVT